MPGTPENRRDGFGLPMTGYEPIFMHRKGTTGKAVADHSVADHSEPSSSSKGHGTRATGRFKM